MNNPIFCLTRDGPDVYWGIEMEDGMKAGHDEALDTLVEKRNDLLRQEQSIRQRRQSLEATIRTLSNGNAEELLADLPYKGMGATEAIVTHLKAHRQPLRAKEIADALTDGGLVSDSEDFPRLVDNMLRRVVAKDRHGVIAEKIDKRVHYFIQAGHEKSPAEG